MHMKARYLHPAQQGVTSVVVAADVGKVNDGGLKAVI